MLKRNTVVLNRHTITFKMDFQNTKTLQLQQKTKQRQPVRWVCPFSILFLTLALISVDKITLGLGHCPAYNGAW
jgi:hypothetical protein